MSWLLMPVYDVEDAVWSTGFNAEGERPKAYKFIISSSWYVAHAIMHTVTNILLTKHSYFLLLLLISQASAKDELEWEVPSEATPEPR